MEIKNKGRMDGVLKTKGYLFDGADFPMIVGKAELAFGNGHYYS
jgi:hypothetical protein